MDVVAGLDEAGRGPAVGPLFAAAVVLGEGEWEGMTDSKKLSAKKREEWYSRIVEGGEVGVGVVEKDEIDEKGMGEAQKLVFERAMEDLERGGCAPTRLVVDGLVFRKWREVPHVCLPKADATHSCVSAASIVAKVRRDRWVEELCKENPDLDGKYSLLSNKGYLSPAHMKGIQDHGKTEWHRKSFKIKGIDK